MAKKNALNSLGIPQSEIEKAIRESAEVKAEKKRVAQQLATHAKSISPVDHGDYAAAWKPEQKRNGETRAINRNYKAHWIEYGTGAPGPTRAFAVAEKTAHAFGGDLTIGVDIDQDDE
ncbi:HK97 gp10 family phage protein [Mycolicibacterium sp. XJ775]